MPQNLHRRKARAAKAFRLVLRRQGRVEMVEFILGKSLFLFQPFILLAEAFFLFIGQGKVIGKDKIAVLFQRLAKLSIERELLRGGKMVRDSTETAAS